jgi:hypothetical protein
VEDMPLVHPAVLPLQIIEQVDEPRKETGTKIQQTLFDIDDRGRQLKGWTNNLIWGDNKLILASLKNGPLREEIEKQGNNNFDVPEGYANFQLKTIRMFCRLGKEEQEYIRGPDMLCYHLIDHIPRREIRPGEEGP